MDESLNIIAQQLGQQAVSGMQNPVSTLTRRFGTVVAVGTMGTLDVQVANASGDNVLRGLQMTTACRGAAVGDRCIVETYAHISVVTGIIAHDNSDYVKHIESGTEQPTIPAHDVRRVEVEFSEPFSDPPVIVANAANGPGTASGGVSFNAMPVFIEEGGFTLAVYNNSATQAAVLSSWVAIEQ